MVVYYCHESCIFGLFVLEITQGAIIQSFLFHMLLANTVECFDHSNRSAEQIYVHTSMNCVLIMKFEFATQECIGREICQ